MSIDPFNSCFESTDTTINYPLTNLALPEETLSSFTFTSPSLTITKLLVGSCTVLSMSTSKILNIQCPKTLTILTNQNFTEQTYFTNDPALEFYFPEFTTNPYCLDASWFYTAQLSNGSALPVFVTRFYSSSQYFKIYTSDDSFGGAYTIKITGSVSG